MAGVMKVCASMPQSVTLVTIRPALPFMKPSLEPGSAAVFDAPARAVGTIFDADAHGRQFITDGVGSAPVLVGACLLACRNQCLDGIGIDVARTAAEPVFGRLLQQTERATGRQKRRLGLRCSGLPRLIGQVGQLSQGVEGV